MSKWIIVRAGSTAWQEENRLQGTIPLPLCAAGQAELERMGLILEGFAPQLLFSSGNESSGKSADFLAERLDLKPRKIAQLREYDCGLWQGMLIADIESRFASAYRSWRQDPTSVSPCQGESLEQVSERVQEALVTIRKKTRSKTAVIVAAHLASAVIDCVLSESPLSQMWSFADEPCSMKLYQFETEAALKPASVEPLLVGTPAA